MGGINDWFADAEGRGLQDPRYDHENDDPADYAPQSWYDRQPAPSYGTSSRSRGASSQVSSRASRSPAPAKSNQELADAIQKIRFKVSGIGPKGITRRLREIGWPRIDAADVEKILSAGSVRKAKTAALTSANSKGKPPSAKKSTSSKTPRLHRVGPTGKAKRRASARNASASRAPRSTAHPESSDATLLRVARTEPRSRADACAACGLVADMLGRCRCS